MVKLKMRKYESKEFGEVYTFMSKASDMRWYCVEDMLDEGFKINMDITDPVNVSGFHVDKGGKDYRRFVNEEGIHDLALYLNDEGFMDFVEYITKDANLNEDSRQESHFVFCEC